MQSMTRISALALCFLINAFLHAQQTAPAPVPAVIDPPAGARLLLQLKGIGTQVYLCAVKAEQAAWQFKGPSAKLLDASNQPVGTHFAGPTWHLNDGSEVQGKLIGSKPSPDTGSIPWLLLSASVHTGSGKLTPVDFIQRTDTKGGAMPSTGCDARHAGTLSRVPYTATYTFYAK